MLQEVPALLLVVLDHTGRAGSALREGLADEAVLGEAKETAVDAVGHRAQHRASFISPLLFTGSKPCPSRVQGGCMDASRMLNHGSHHLHSQGSCTFMGISGNVVQKPFIMHL